MKTFTLMIPLVAFTAACGTPEQSAMAGAVTGAALGAAVSDSDDREKGALIGAAAGLTAGVLIGNSSKPGDCIYRDAYGRRYIAPC